MINLSIAGMAHEPINAQQVPVRFDNENKSAEQGTNAQASVGAGPTEQTTLQRGVIYSLNQLTSLGYTFEKLAINRSVSERAVKDKMKSIKAADGVICPCLVCTARQCLETGLAVVRSDRTYVAIGDPDVDMILVVIDGQHRYEAVKQLNLRKGEQSFECYFYVPLNSNPRIIDILREANVATRPWKGGDFLTNLIVTAPATIDCEMLLWVQGRYGECGDVASWLWATLDRSRVYLKSMLVKASKSEDELRKLADKTDFEFGKKLYEAAESKLTSLVKLKVVPLTVMSILKRLTASVSKQEATNMICSFFQSLTDMQVKEIQSCKRNETQTKDQQIESKLNGYWQAYSKPS